MHTSHLLDFNTINTNVSLSRTLILKEAIHFPSCEYNINKRKQGSVPQNVGELALDIPFLISLKIKLSFIPMHVHACTLLLMAQPKVNLLNKNEGSNPPNSFFELPPLLSFISPGKKRHQVPHFRHSALHHQNSALSNPPSIQKQESSLGADCCPSHSSKGQPACLQFPLLSLTPAQREELSGGDHQEKFPSLLVSPEKSY